ncbi:MAG: hypothetical protein GY777_21160 [Candidatus Brocadiaceae bacterium]|nr:hypothetical protein [Candidatus Brocadiaceae bacterium]
MRLEELRAGELTDEKMQWVYDLIKEAYESGRQNVTVSSEKLTMGQFEYLEDLGYDGCYDFKLDVYEISGW